MKGVGRAALAALALAVGLSCLTGLSGCVGAKGRTAAAPQAEGDALAAGDAALARGDRGEAGRQYLAALKAGADPVLVHTRLGDLYLGNGMADKARTEYQAALKAKPKHAPALQGLGFALYLGGGQAEAAEALAKALDRDPSLSRAAALLGTIENRRGQPEAALAVFDRSLAAAFDPDVENNRGLSLMLLGRNDEAVAAFRKALAAKKTAKIANNLGLALCKLRRFDEAYAAFAAAGSESAALNNTGVCYMEAGDKARAQQYFERAIAANPTFYQKAQDNLSRLAAVEEVNLPAPAVSPAPAPAPPAQSPAPVQPAAPAPAPVSPAPVPARTAPPVQAAPAPGQPRPFQPVETGPRKAEEKPAAPAPASRGAAAAEKADRAEMP